MGTCRRAALAGIQERGQVEGMDLQEIPRQDSGRSTHALDHGTAQSQISFLPQVDRQQQLKLYVPTCLEGSAGTTSFYRPVPIREQVWLREAAFKVRKIGGSDAWRNTRKGNETGFRRRHEAQSDRRKQLMYCIISHGSIFIPGIGVLYSFPQVPSSSYLSTPRPPTAQ